MRLATYISHFHYGSPVGCLGVLFLRAQCIKNDSTCRDGNILVTSSDRLATCTWPLKSEISGGDASSMDLLFIHGMNWPTRHAHSAVLLRKNAITFQVDIRKDDISNLLTYRKYIKLLLNSYFPLTSYWMSWSNGSHVFKIWCRFATAACVLSVPSVPAHVPRQELGDRRLRPWLMQRICPKQLTQCTTCNNILLTLRLNKALLKFFGVSNRISSYLPCPPQGEGNYNTLCVWERHFLHNVFDRVIVRACRLIIPSFW